jgi:TRAP-type C4-dicarboxylate transport system permease small subunit
MNNDNVGRMLDWVDEGGQFVREQAPEVAREIIDLAAYTAGLKCFLCLAGYIVIWQSWKYVKRNRVQLEKTFPIVFGAPVVGLVIGLWILPIFYTSMYALMKVYIAPRIVVLEYARHIF